MRCRSSGSPLVFAELSLFNFESAGATTLGLYSILQQSDLELVFALLPLSTTASSGTILRSQTGRRKVKPLYPDDIVTTNDAPVLGERK
ncbi:MAG: hypothetical protein JWM11_196 [Planctomycetaceae bacterium]|nr:hypothetical protein [Planctomycetaceae bacterium]